MPAQSPYSTVNMFGKPAPTHVPEDSSEDVARVRAYDTYEDLYHNTPDIWTAVLKSDAGNELFRRYIPGVRSIIEANNRYLGRDLGWAPSLPPPAAEAESAQQEQIVRDVRAALDALFTREQFGAKFLSMKRWFLTKGDGLFHVTADPSKPEGKRIRINELDPASYFAISDPADSERVIGCYIVNVILDDEGEEIAARLEYRKIQTEEDSATYGAPVGQIYVRLTFWELGDWDDRALSATAAAPTPLDPPDRFLDDRFELLLTGQTLPPQITAIPVYHFINNRKARRLYGISEVQGIETLFCGVNQTVTDQEVAIALNGLGVYWTDSGKPVDRDGNEIPWSISPAGMLELEEGKTVGRLNGITSVQPSLDHVNYLKAEQRETTGTPEVAVGSVDSTIAESGVALALRFMPVTAKVEEKEEELLNKLDQMIYDLLFGWMPAFEGMTWPPELTVRATFGNPIPVNRQEVITELVELVNAGIVPPSYAREQLAEKLGYVFTGNEGEEVAAERAALEDAVGARLDAAVAGTPEEEVGL